MLSVVMPCRDAVTTIGRAIASVRSVFEPGSFEIVVADGGSRDGTLDHLRAADVRLLEGVDGSLYEGLNKAIDAARGDHVIWLNADDVVLSAMAELVTAARTGNAEIATGEAEIASGDHVEWRSENNRRRMDTASILFAVPAINCRVLRADLLRQAGPFRTDLGLAADREMLLRLAQMAANRLSLPEPVYRYHSHPGSLTIANTAASRLAVHRSNLDLARYLAGKADADAQRMVAAYERMTRLALARAETAVGSPHRAGKTLLDGWRSQPQTSAWREGLALRRQFRGLGSGW